MNDSSETQRQLLTIAEKLIRHRFNLARLVSGLESDEEKQSEEAVLRADLECAIVDHFDPLVKVILQSAGGLRGKLLEAALDVAGLRHRLECLSKALPRSEHEDAMFEGEMPPDLLTEIKITIGAVIEDQLNDAYQNLVFAMGYDTPEAA
jgi:hypothetical protein